MKLCNPWGPLKKILFIDDNEIEYIWISAICCVPLAQPYHLLYQASVNILPKEQNYIFSLST